VLPLDDRGFERVLPEVAGRPTLVGDKQTLLPGMGGLLEQHVVNWRNRSWSLTAQVHIPDGGANGVILNLGGHSGGWSLYLKDGKPAFAYNLFGMDWTHVRADTPVPAGEHQVRIEFTYDGGGIGKGGDVTLFQDGQKLVTGRVERTEPIGFGYEYTDVGRDAQSRSPTTTPPATTRSPVRSNGSRCKPAPTATTTSSTPARSSTTRWPGSNHASAAAAAALDEEQRSGRRRAHTNEQRHGAWRSARSAGWHKTSAAPGLPSASSWAAHPACTTFPDHRRTAASAIPTATTMR
jgi:hypothetical protein